MFPVARCAFYRLAAVEKDWLPGVRRRMWCVLRAKVLETPTPTTNVSDRVTGSALAETRGVDPGSR